MEAGGNLVPDTDGTNGSPQRSVTNPAGGFHNAFGAGADERLKQCYDAAFEGAMLYNATMSVIYAVRGALGAWAGPDCVFSIADLAALRASASSKPRLRAM